MSSIRDIYPAVRYVDDVDKETDEQCVRCKGNCGFIGITGMWACQGFIPLTNADLIRAMTDEELAAFLAQQPFRQPVFDGWLPLCSYAMGSKICHPNGCKSCWLDWLKAPVEEGKG